MTSFLPFHQGFFIICEYQAYKKFLEKHGREKRIRGLEKYNNEQMFFIGYATVIHNELVWSFNARCTYRPGSYRCTFSQNDTGKHAYC
ncbi:hypothetical protein COOONC_03937 [Cooperia oncophora]